MKFPVRMMAAAGIAGTLVIGFGAHAQTDQGSFQVPLNEPAPVPTGQIPAPPAPVPVTPQPSVTRPGSQPSAATSPVSPAVQTPSPAPASANPFVALVNDPTVQNFLHHIAVPLSVTIAAISGSTLLVVAAAGDIQFAINLSQLFQWLEGLRLELLGLVRLKKRKPWGRVIDALNGRPVAGALVQMYSAEFDKVLESTRTDADGRFAFWVVPGTYFLRASHAGFAVKETKEIAVHTDDQAIALEIPLALAWEELRPRALLRLNLWNLSVRFLDQVNPYLLATGTIVSGILAAADPTLFNIALVCLYIVLDGCKIVLSLRLRHPEGLVLDAGNHAPIPLAVVRIFDAKTNVLMATKVTDRRGRFHVLLARGSYYLTCAKEGHHPYHSAPIAVESDSQRSFSIELA
ncbi:MAG: carboxypeptidase regulatory-like domain-containing protein [Patescibacteria group bacterium]|nr:carboxypeptidase regulatory-like domain-containing protein [Patescibacteria group bacterium]